jgi:PAS domain S-box-containing protein
VGSNLLEDPNVGELVVNSRDVTERKQIEDRLREAEARYRALVEEIPAVTYIQEVGYPSITTYVSPQVKTLLGYEPEECTSDAERWAKILLGYEPEDKERVLAEDRRTNETGEPFSAEYRRVAKDGSVVWIRDEAALVRDEEGNPSYWLGVKMDVTERKEAEARLKASEVELRALFAAMDDVILVLDAQGRCLKVAPTNPSLLYKPVAERIGNTLHEVSPREQADVFRDQIRRALQARQKVDIEYSLPIGGNEVWFAGTISPVTEDGVFFVARDITERKRAEKRLREAEARYRTLVERIPAITYIDRPDNTAVYTSPQIEAMLGYAIEEWQANEMWAERLHPDDREWVLAADGHSKAAGEPFSEEYRLLHKDGSVVWVRDEAVLLRSEAGEPLYWQGILVDITERKKAEEQLARQAFHDPLTGLANRALFMDRLGHALRRLERRKEPVAVLFLDLATSNTSTILSATKWGIASSWR